MHDCVVSGFGLLRLCHRTIIPYGLYNSGTAPFILMIRRHIFFIILFLAGIAAAYGYFGTGRGVRETPKNGTPRSVPTAAPAGAALSSLFVPYWDVSKPVDDYDRYYYFGIAPSSSGINTQDEGYAQLDSFVDAFDPAASYLTVRMTDTDLNGTILKNESAQKAIISEAVSLAADKQFAGIALDLEYSGLFDGSMPGRISTFSHRFADAVHEARLRYVFIVYGDVLYRGRPYDLKELAAHSDEIIVMAYDFHKSRGEPGPNFPLNGKEQYGYDLVQLESEISLKVPADKLTFAFGMYGYEWTVDEKQRPVKPAAPLSLNKINQSYDDECVVLNCVKRRDAPSGEMEIQFVSANGDYHIIWHEDEESVRRKQEYIRKQGINSFAYWANGYFQKKP